MDIENPEEESSIDEHQNRKASKSSKIKRSSTSKDDKKFKDLPEDEQIDDFCKKGKRLKKLKANDSKSKAKSSASKLNQKSKAIKKANKKEKEGKSKRH